MGFGELVRDSDSSEDLYGVSQYLRVFQMMDVGPLTMTMYDKVKYIYPMGAKAVGWLLALSSILMLSLIHI